MVVVPDDRLAGQALEAFFVNTVPYNNRKQSAKLSFKVNETSQAKGQNDLCYHQIIVLRVIVLGIFLLQMPNVKVNEDVQYLGREYDENYNRRLSTYVDAFSQRNRCHESYYIGLKSFGHGSCIKVTLAKHLERTMRCRGRSTRNHSSACLKSS